MQYPKNYLKEAYKLVRERGGVCIADEVRMTLCILMNNFGRIIVKQSFGSELRRFTFTLFAINYYLLFVVCYYIISHKDVCYYALMQSGISGIKSSFC